RPDANSSTLNPAGACGTAPAGRPTVRGKFEADGEAPGRGKSAGVMCRQTPGASARQSPKAAWPVRRRRSCPVSWACALPASAIGTAATTITLRIHIPVFRVPKAVWFPTPSAPPWTPYIRLLQKRQKITNIGSATKAPGRLAMMHVRRSRPLLALFAILTALVLVASDADARAGRGGSLGSRGTKSLTTAPPTATAPGGGTALQRTTAQPGPTTGAHSPGLFGGAFNRPGLFGGLLGGFLGAGLLGLLFGHGLFGGMGSIASIFGLLLQIALVVIVARLIWGWWQRRQTPAYAGAPMMRDAPPNYQSQSGYAAPGGGTPSGGGVDLHASDYDTFERLLGVVQTAYGAEDINTLRQHATPEMVSYLADD